MYHKLCRLSYSSGDERTRSFWNNNNNKKTLNVSANTYAFGDPWFSSIANHEPYVRHLLCAYRLGRMTNDSNEIARLLTLFRPVQHWLTWTRPFRRVLRFFVHCRFQIKNIYRIHRFSSTFHIFHYYRHVKGRATLFIRITHSFIEYRERLTVYGRR